MPLYDYRCEECGCEMEVLKRSDDPDPKCPKCESEKFKKKPNSASFELRGSGYYKAGFSGGKR